MTDTVTIARSSAFEAAKVAYLESIATADSTAEFVNDKDKIQTLLKNIPSEERAAFKQFMIEATIGKINDILVNKINPNDGDDDSPELQAAKHAFWSDITRDKDTTKAIDDTGKDAILATLNDSDKEKFSLHVVKSAIAVALAGGKFTA